ncbi:hypothetical protein [Bacillus solimangrovi]|uniref:Uncharacterized protein n=1 Tax=Bacillus solimangrovi TaxID=1305675 RepID=A0A1E5LBZ1_9BACI|nr:hypothetical protein [Bacillus solimangrovi]OEH91608.1 hypothetical protein BFG57_04345 [Bacillus solimangrovi]
MNNRWFLFIILVIANIGAFYYYLLGLMRLEPLFLAAIIQFTVVLVSLFIWNKRNTFRGIRTKRNNNQ